MIFSLELQILRPFRVFFGAFSFAVTTLLGLMLVPLSQHANAASDPLRFMKTVGGALNVEGDMYTGMRIFFNKHPLMVTSVVGSSSVKEELRDDFIELRQKYSINENDVVILYTSCSGSSCTVSDFYFLTITPAGKLTVSGPINSHKRELDEGDVKVIGSTLEISVTTMLTPRKRKMVRWKLTDGKLEQIK